MQSIFFQILSACCAVWDSTLLSVIPYSFGHPALITNNIFFCLLQILVFYPALFVVTRTNVSRLVLVFTGGRYFECLVVFSFSLIHSFFCSAKKQNYFPSTELSILTGYV